MAQQWPSNKPDWLSKGDAAWHMTAATLVCVQSMPGLVILYGSMVKKKWAVNSAFMALYAFAAVLICWVGWAYRMSFGDRLLPLWGKAGPALGRGFLLNRAEIPATAIRNDNGELLFMEQPSSAMASQVYYQFAFAAISVIFLAGSLVGRMHFLAWMLFVPMWLTFSYTIGAFSLWGGGFLYHYGVLDFAGGYVIHLSSGTAGLTAAYWVGPRLKKDRERFIPNNVLVMLTGAGFLWLGWSGFSRGAEYGVSIQTSMAILNTHICTATSVLTWTCLDVFFFGKPSVIGAVQGMMTGLVCITPGAGLIQGWGALLLGVIAGSLPWFTMLILHKKFSLLQSIDDALWTVHTHAVAGVIGGIFVGIFAEPKLCLMIAPAIEHRGAIFGRYGGAQLGKQIVGAMFVIVWNIVATTIICLAIKIVVPLRMNDDALTVGDDAAHGEEAYALWADGERTEQHLQVMPQQNLRMDTYTTKPSIMV